MQAFYKLFGRKK